MEGDGAVVRGQAYGIHSIRIDGNDALAVYSAVHAAREMAISESRPILIEVKLNFYVAIHLTSANLDISYVKFDLSKMNRHSHIGWVITLHQMTPPSIVPQTR